MQQRRTQHNTTLIGIFILVGLMGIGLVYFGVHDILFSRTVTPPGKNWQLVFVDEFEQPTLNTRNWDTCFHFVGTFDGQPGCVLPDYTNMFRPDDVLPQTNGTLHLQTQARKNIAFDVPYTYTAGMLSSFSTFTFTYGYAEARLKVPHGNGFWTAFWLMPADKSWPPEIDVVEVLGRQPEMAYHSVHYADGQQQHASVTQPYTHTSSLADGFHVYAVKWTAQEMIWYVDGVERNRLAQNVPTTPMYVLATLGIGRAGSWGDAPNAQTVFPNKLEIDYVRVYQEK